MLKEKPYEHPEVRSRVISLLGTIGDLAAVPVLETLSQQIKPEKTAQRAQLREVILGMARIAAMGDAAKREEVGKSLAAHLENIYPDVVQAAAEAMGLLRYEPSRQKLVGILNKTTSLGAAMKAAEALGKMQAKDCLGEGADAKDAEGNLRILPMLAKSLEEKDLMSLALSLVKALRDMNVRNRGVVDHLILAIMSPHDGVCQEAMLLVGGEWKDESALGPINEVFKDARNRNVPLRKCALQVLAAYPPERGATYLFPVLRCPKAATRKDPKKAAEEELFARIAVQYFDKPGNILPEHRTELLSIVSDADNNNRAACIRWVSLKGIWKSEECVDKLVPRFEEDDRDLVDAARLAFRSHPSALACLRMIQALPKNPPPNPRWQDFQKNDVVDWYFYNNYKGKEDPPKVMLNGKELEAWFKKNEKHFEWQAEE
jgi:HEAT repeat protein